MIYDDTDTTNGARRAEQQPWNAPTAAVHTVELGAPAPVKRHKRRTPWGWIILTPFAVVAVLVLGLLVVGLVVGSTPQAPPTYNPTPSAPDPAATTATPSVHTSTSVAAAPAAPPTTAVAPPPAPATIAMPEGTWTIGEDYPAGTYKATSVPDTCYWEIARSGTNGADLLRNGLGPGNLRVTLKAGQDFSSRDCGSWSLVKR